VRIDHADRTGRRLSSRITRNLAVWSIPSRLAIFLVLTPLPAVPVAVYLSLTNQHWFYALTDEDALVEWLQTAALLVGCGTYSLLFGRHWLTGRRITAVLSLLVAIAALVVVGEELSWGQRILGWATPPGLVAINDQGELNIHNIGSIATLSRLMQFAAVGYGLLAPMLALLPQLSGRLTDSYFVPPVALASFFVGPFGYWAARIPLDASPAIFRASEITELSAYTGLAVLGWLSLRRLRAGAAHSTANEPP